MGYSYRNKGLITDYTPDNTRDSLYILGSEDISLSDLIDRANEHFGASSLKDLHIRSEKIHTHCVTYDRYDAGDYTDYIIVTRK